MQGQLPFEWGGAAVSASPDALYKIWRDSGIWLFRENRVDHSRL